MDPAVSKLFLDDEDALQQFGLLVERAHDGTVRANVRHLGVHSRSFECGYTGAGPSELALSVMHALFPPIAAAASSQAAVVDLVEPVHLGWESIRVSATAFRLHHSFEADFISKLAPEGGFIPIETIRHWIAQRCLD